VTVSPHIMDETQNATWANTLPESGYYGAFVSAENAIEALRLLKKEAKRQILKGYNVDGWNAWLQSPDCVLYRPVKIPQSRASVNRRKSDGGIL
jgi:hypothetical protein